MEALSNAWSGLKDKLSGRKCGCPDGSACVCSNGQSANGQSANGQSFGQAFGSTVPGMTTTATAFGGRRYRKSRRYKKTRKSRKSKKSRKYKRR